MKQRHTPTHRLGAAARIACLALAAVAGLFGAYAAQAEEGSDTKHEPAYPGKAIAVLRATEGNTANGIVVFTQTEEGVLVEAHVNGLAPGAHGFHIHEYGDVSSADGKSAGGHFNPAGHDHAGPDAEKRHVGDLGNLEADENGHANYKRVDKVLQIHGEHGILSRGVVVHSGTDDLASQPTGAAGARVAVGVIGIAKPTG